MHLIEIRRETGAGEMNLINNKKLKTNHTKNLFVIKCIVIIIIMIFASLNADDINEISNFTHSEGNRLSDIENDILNSNSVIGYDVSPHNLSTMGTHGTDSYAQNENCVFCHSENSTIENNVLWKNENSSNSFTSNKNHNVMLSVGSLKCLSCHDGATAANTLPNGFAEFTPTLATNESNSFSIINAAYNDISYQSQGLGNNHPVGIVYDETKEGLNAISDLKIAKLEKGTNKITCASCHEPHGKTNSSFLTVSNEGSSLCLDCHNK